MKISLNQRDWVSYVFGSFFGPLLCNAYFEFFPHFLFGHSSLQKFWLKETFIFTRYKAFIDLFQKSATRLKLFPFFFIESVHEQNSWFQDSDIYQYFF